MEKANKFKTDKCGQTLECWFVFREKMAKKRVSILNCETECEVLFKKRPTFRMMNLRWWHTFKATEVLSWWVHHLRKNLKKNFWSTSGCRVEWWFVLLVATFANWRYLNEKVVLSLHMKQKFSFLVVNASLRQGEENQFEYSF